MLFQLSVDYLYHQGSYPRTEPTVGQAHRIFFAREKLSTEIQLEFLTLLISKPRQQKKISAANFEIENRRVRNRQISLRATQVHFTRNSP